MIIFHIDLICPADSFPRFDQDFYKMSRWFGKDACVTCWHHKQWRKGNLMKNISLRVYLNCGSVRKTTTNLHLVPCEWKESHPDNVQLLFCCCLLLFQPGAKLGTDLTHRPTCLDNRWDLNFRMRWKAVLWRRYDCLSQTCPESDLSDLGFSWRTKQFRTCLYSAMMAVVFLISTSAFSSSLRKTSFSWWCQQ